MRRSLVLDVIVRVVFHSALLLGIYLLFAGHNQPGGGFIGGLVVAAAFGLQYVAGGLDAVRASSRAKPWTLIGAGLVVATITALVPLIIGGAALEGDYVELDLGPLGIAKVTSALSFDIGVFLVVVGMVLMLFEAFGEDPEVVVHDELDTEGMEARS